MKSWILLGTLTVCFAATAAVDEASPYGICIHGIVGTNCVQSHYAALKSAGIAWGRADFDWQWIETSKGHFDFPSFDPAIFDAHKTDVQLLPILHRGPWFCKPYAQHEKDWRNYVRLFARRYRSEFPVYEIWNEVNGQAEIGNPTNYTAYLKAAYEEIKAVNPQAKVAIGGFAGLPIGMLEEIYRLGGAKWFDIMNFHHYEFPRPPEEQLLLAVGRARQLMEKYADGAKPIWITETGYPTQREHFAARGWLKRAFEIAFDGRQRRLRRVAHVTLRSGYRTGFDREGAAYQASIRRLLRSEMPDPDGTAIEFVVAEDLARLLQADPPDVLVYPFTERYPVESFDDVVRYVEDGGVLVQVGKAPLGSPNVRGEDGCYRRVGDASWKPENLSRLRVAWKANWDGPDYPVSCQMFPVEPADGIAVPKAGVRAERYLLPFPGSRDRFVPVLASRDRAGSPLVGAAVYLRANGGAVIVGSYNERTEDLWTADELRQAQMLPRSFLALFAAGIEKVFWYTYMCGEHSNYDQEDWFGIVKARTNGEPYPAMLAYATLIAQRPSGSVGPCPGEEWKDDKTGVFYPSWTRPDGTKAGAFWSLEPCVRRLSFTSATVRFFDLFGRTLAPRKDHGDGCYTFVLGESPVYYCGAEMKHHGLEKGGKPMKGE